MQFRRFDKVAISLRYFFNDKLIEFQQYVVKLHDQCGCIVGHISKHNLPHTTSCSPQGYALCMAQLLRHPLGGIVSASAWVDLAPTPCQRAFLVGNTSMV